MRIMSTSGIYIWVEYPIVTSYQKDSIRDTVEVFGRNYDRINGFVEFNVDLNKWLMEQDVNLPYVPYAKMINLLALSGNFNLNAFPLSEPAVNPIFYDKTGNLLR